MVPYDVISTECIT